MFFHEHKLIKPQRASFWQRLGPLPPQHTRPGPRVIAVTTLRAQAGQRPSPARPDSDHLPEISDLCWNGTCFRTIKDLPGMQPPGNHHLPVCRGRSLLCQTHVISLPGSFPAHCPRTPSPPCVYLQRKNPGLAGEPVCLLRLSWINNYAPCAFSLGCYIRKTGTLGSYFVFFSPEWTYQSGCLSGWLTQGRSQ